MSILLSLRIRPNSEAAPWVIEEVRKLEEEVERLREALRQTRIQRDADSASANRYASEAYELRKERNKVLAELEQTLAEVERLRDIVAVNDQRLATLHDEKQRENNRLRELLSAAHEAIRCGFMDGSWATAVQTKKELLPWSAVLESRHAELVINQIRKELAK